MNWQLASSSQVSLVPTVCPSNREIGTCRGHRGERRVCGCQSRVGGHGTRGR